MRRPLLAYVWSDQIALWKIFWLSIACYIVANASLFFLLRLLNSDVYVAQFSGHLNIYTYFFASSDTSNLFENQIFIDFVKDISSGLGSFYESAATFKLASIQNANTVLLLAVVNTISFVFWLWWCISLWRNSNNTNSQFASVMAKLFAVNGALSPVYYFFLAFLFLNAYVSDLIDTPTKEISVSENEVLMESDFGTKTNQKEKYLEKQHFEIIVPADWILQRNEEGFMHYTHCVEQSQCAHFILKSLSNDITLNFDNLKRWIQQLNTNASIKNQKKIEAKNQSIYYIGYSALYNGTESQIIQMGFKFKEKVYILEWIGAEKHQSFYFPIFKAMFNKMTLKS